MKTFLLPATALALLASTTLIAQPAERKISTYTNRPPVRTSASKYRIARKVVVGRELRLRGGATPTGLTGYYDYQSNGGSPGYLVVRRGTPDVIVTTYMDADDGTSIDNANASRRTGYAFSADGGATWTNTRSIFDLRLGFPYLQTTPSGRPFIAAHGDLGDGDRSFLFASGEIGGVNDYNPLAELPLTTESGREGGVAWPTFVITKDGSKAVVIGSYSNDIGQPEAPLQVATVSLVDGATEQRWRNLADSAISTTSGGRAVAAVSESGRIGVAWYRFETDEDDRAWGVYYAESADNGATWSAPVAVLVGEQVYAALNINGDVDTLSAGANLDLAFRGDEPQLVFTGNLNGLLQFANVLYWSPATGLRVIAMSHDAPGLGAYSIPLSKRQQNMASIAYPTVSVGDDGRHVVVAFSAVAQTADVDGDLIEDAVSDDGFQYYRLWGVGSADGGRNWGRPFVIQNFAEKATDSASIEYPSAAETARVSAGSMELPLVFQARRYPGMFIYTGSGDSQTDAGPITECSQYFQRFVVTPAMFLAASSIAHDGAINGVDATLYPNRTSSVASLELTLARASTIDVRLVDALGREVARPVENRPTSAGVERIHIDATGLAAGIYHCVVRHSDGVVTEKLEVVR
jgi:hypothetical protein